jgi:hypothetical protein
MAKGVRKQFKDVKVDFVAWPRFEKCRTIAELIGAGRVRELLRKNFDDGPAAAANAHAAYKSWMHEAVEGGDWKPMPYPAQRWRDLLEQWNRHHALKIGGFADIDGIDFNPVPREQQSFRQRPRQRM